MIGLDRTTETETLRKEDACPICGATAHSVVVRGSDRLYRTTAEVFSVVRCRACGSLRLWPRPDSAELARFYPPAYWFEPDATRATRWAERYRRVVVADHARFVESAYRAADGVPGPLLDVGCGGGLLAGVLRERGIPAIGLDTSVEACRIASERHAVPAFTGDILRPPFRPRTFRVVTLFHVLEHVPDPRAFIGAMSESLADGGRCVIQVPNAESWQFRWFGARWNGLDIPRHLQHFRPRDLQSLLEDCGLEPLRWKHFSWRDNPAGLATSLAPGFDPMARRVRRLPAGLAPLAAHFLLTAAAIPFALLEAAFEHGSTVMVEARKR